MIWQPSLHNRKEEPWNDSILWDVIDKQNDSCTVYTHKRHKPTRTDVKFSSSFFFSFLIRDTQQQPPKKNSFEIHMHAHIKLTKQIKMNKTRSVCRWVWLFLNLCTTFQVGFSSSCSFSYLFFSNNSNMTCACANVSALFAF